MVLYIIVNILRLVSNPINSKHDFYSCSTFYHVKNRMKCFIIFRQYKPSEIEALVLHKEVKKETPSPPQQQQQPKKKRSMQQRKLSNPRWWILRPQKDIFYLVRSNSFFSTFGDGWILHSTSSVSVLSTKLNKLQFHTFVGEELNIFVRKK
jgi:hypothetical protein